MKVTRSSISNRPKVARKCSWRRWAPLDGLSERAAGGRGAGRPAGSVIIGWRGRRACGARRVGVGAGGRARAQTRGGRPNACQPAIGRAPRPRRLPAAGRR